MPVIEQMIVAFSRRPLNMSLTQGDTCSSLKNREMFLAQQEIDYRDLVCARQVHGQAIALVGDKERGRGACLSETAIADTDALITATPGVPIAVFTADCLSVLLYDPEIPCVAAVHAGWRGTQGGILAKTIAGMKKEFHAHSETMRVFLGPCIRPCCYEVGEEFLRLFPSDVLVREGKYYFDLAEANKRQLFQSGIGAHQIVDEGFCTS